MVRLKKVVPPTETGITRRAVADLQDQIEKLSAAVAALSTQHATMVFRQRNPQADNSDDFEEDENPLSRLRHQPPIPNKNNDSDLDLDLDAKVQDTRNNENSYVVQLGDPIFDVYTEEDDENYSEQNFFPIFDVFDQDATEKFSTYDMADVDVAEISPIYDMFDDDEMEQVTIEEVEVQSVKFNEYVYAQGTPTLSPEYFATSNEVIRDFNLKDTSPPFQTMMTTVGRSDNYFWKSSRSNKREDHMDVPKPELIHICEERAGNNFLDLQKKHINYGAWRNNFNRHINRKPPDRVQHQGREAEQEETKNLIAKITKLEEALLLEQEKNQTLEHELSEIRRNIRMLNTGSNNLDKILCMGRTEKTTAGLGYQGGPSSSHIVFVRGNSVEPNKTGAVSESATNLPMELLTASNVYTCYCKTSLMKHQDCVRNIWSTGIMSTILQTHSDLLGEEFVGILHQKHSNAPYCNLHQAHMRVVRKGEVEDCNDEKLREAVYTILDEDSSEQTMISLGLEILHHHSFESTLSLNKLFLASILVKIHKNELYMVTLVSGRSLQAGESHSYANVLFERNTDFIVCWKNMIMVNWNINESSDSFSMNLFKKNRHAEGLTAIYDVSFPRRLVSPLGSFLVYVFNGGEDMIFWSLLAPKALMRILGFSYNITVFFINEISLSRRDIWITRISSFLRMYLLPLRFRKKSLESVVYWQVLHCGFHKLRIWDVGKLLKNLIDISTTATWRSYVTCVSSKYLWEAYSCVLWVHCNTIFLQPPSWIGFSTLIWVISKEVFPFQDPWNKVFQLLANYHLFHVKLRGLGQPLIHWSLLKIFLRSINGEISNHCQFLDFKTCEKKFEDVRRYACGVEWDLHYTKMDSFDLLFVKMQLGVVQNSRFFVEFSSHHVNQVGYYVIYLITNQEEFPLKHRLWRMAVFFPLNLLLLGICFDVNVGKLGVMRTASFRFSYDDLTEIGVWHCATHINILEWFFRWVWPPSYLCGLVLIGIVDLSGAVLTTGAFLKKVIIKKYLQLCDRMHFDVLFPREKTVLCFVNQCDKVLGAKVFEHYLEFWVSVHDLHSTRRTRFLHGTSYYVNWLEKYECTCDQAPATTSIGWKKMSVRVIKHQLLCPGRLKGHMRLDVVQKRGTRTQVRWFSLEGLGAAISISIRGRIFQTRWDLMQRHHAWPTSNVNVINVMT